MKCTAIAKKINNVDTMFSGVPQYDEVPCTGEMIEVGVVHDELPIVNVFGEPVVEKKLYQCESCKTIKLC